MLHDALVLTSFTLVGIGGFFLGYGWAAWIEKWHDQ